MQHERSKQLYERALRVIPGGVNSPVRAFKSVGGEPLFVSRAEGPYLFDADGNRFLDYVGSWGPLILGHAPAVVLEAIAKAARDGTSFGACTVREIELAERVAAAVPSVQKVRFVNSGTEATMSAARLARAFCKRDRILKFAGCYHGHADGFLSEGAGSGLATLGIPGSAGVPAAMAADTLTLPYNDLDAVAELFARAGKTIAAIILEPIACNVGLVPPQPGFLAGLRRLCDEHGALLIFDEVITGFRVARGGAQELFGIKADLTCFGKIIGGGLPVGAYGGRADIMNLVAPLGPVYQAGTLSGNPLAMAAGIATLDELGKSGFYERLDASAARLVDGMAQALARHGKPALAHRVGSIVGLYFKAHSHEPPRNYEECKLADTERFGRFFRALLAEGVYIAPSAFEVAFVSSAHAAEHLDATLVAMEKAMSRLA